MKKFVKSFLILCLALFCTLGLFACASKPKDSGEGEGGEKIVDNTPVKDSQGLIFYPKDGTAYTVSLGDARFLSKVVIPATFKDKPVVGVVCDADDKGEPCISKEIVLPDSIVSISEGAFKRCINIKKMVFPDSLVTIGNSAFRECYNLMSVTVGKNVKSIGSLAFFYCVNLVEIINFSSLEIPKGTDAHGHIGCYAYDIKVPSEGAVVESAVVKKDDYVFYNHKGTNYLMGYDGDDIELTFPANYEGGSYSVYKYAFFSNNSIINVNVGNGVDSIGSSAFDACANLSSVTVGSNVATIGNSAFANCNKLVEIINKSSLKFSIGGEDNGKIALNALNIKDDGSSDVVNKNGYLFYPFGGVNYLLGYVGTSKELTLPDNYNGGEYEIFEQAFFSNDITKLTIGAGVKAIRDGAFKYCRDLESVTMGSNVLSIGESAFDGCNSLKAIEINGKVKSIGKNAFNACKALESVTIGDSVETIGESAFSACTAIKNVSIGEGVLSIGDSAFYNCNNMTSLSIGKSVTSIGATAFKYCGMLKTISFSGTKSQWEGISKDSTWKDNTKINSIVCSDEVITIAL